MNEMRALALDGEASCGEVDCCLQKWSEEVGQIFEIEPYEGYMGFVSAQDNGVPACGDLISYYDEALVMRYVTEELDWYELRYPDKKNEVEELRGLFQCESLLMNKGNTELYNQAEFAFDELAKLIKRFVVHEHEKDDFLNRLAEAKATGLVPVREMMQRLKQYREKYHFSAPLSREEKQLMNHLLNCW